MDQFDEWTLQKREHHFKQDIDSFHINVRDIWYCAIGRNIGCEENGKKFFRRPVLVIKKVGSLFFVVPLSSQGKDSKYNYTLHNATFFEGFAVDTSRALLSQAKVVDKRRFLDHIGYISKDEYLIIKEKLTALLL